MEDQKDIRKNHRTAGSGKAAEKEPAVQKKTSGQKTDRPAVQTETCSAAKKCGGCFYNGVPYEEQLQKKQKTAEALLSAFCSVDPVIGMNYPYYYRGKVHHALGRDKKGNIISGSYMKNSRVIVPAEKCLLEDRDCQKIIGTVRELIASFKLKVYDDRNGFGLMKHVMIRKAYGTGEIMVILITTDPVFPSRNNFAKALAGKHPEITTIIQNINTADTGMVLGNRNVTLFGPGFIKEKLCGLTFTMSPNAFFQVNPKQTEKLYQTAMEFADLHEDQLVIDAYCGTGTIGLIAAQKAGQVIGVELNKDAVKDAVSNAKTNQCGNARFVQGDAGAFMEEMAEAGEKADVVFMDPPRSGSTEQFLKALCRLQPQKIVYVSCNPETLARDLSYLTKKHYRVEKIRPVDMFPVTDDLETVCRLVLREPAAHRRNNVDVRKR